MIGYPGNKKDVRGGEETEITMGKAPTPLSSLSHQCGTVPLLQDDRIENCRMGTYVKKGGARTGRVGLI